MVNVADLIKPLKSLLFVPGNRHAMLEKASTYGADALIPDMEDSVPPSSKGDARGLISSMLPQLALEAAAVIPRVNTLTSGLMQSDLLAVVGPYIDGVTVGKVESREEVLELCSILATTERHLGRPEGITRLIPWIETARGVANVLEICMSSPRICALAFGADDYALDMGITRSDEGSELVYARSVIGIAARVGEAMALDTPYTHYRDHHGLVHEITVARQYGFNGKFAIHPSQVEPIKEGFRPSREEMESARRVVEIYEQSEVLGYGTASLDGAMIDRPVVERARRLLILAEGLERDDLDE